ncbi:hypothetical protein J3E68DRAFT_233991 [Trichoderma sp. SZMC 28012]
MEVKLCLSSGAETRQVEQSASLSPLFLTLATMGVVLVNLTQRCAAVNICMAWRNRRGRTQQQGDGAGRELPSSVYQSVLADGLKGFLKKKQIFKIQGRIFGKGDAIVPILWTWTWVLPILASPLFPLPCPLFLSLLAFRCIYLPLFLFFLLVILFNLGRTMVLSQ